MGRPRLDVLLRIPRDRRGGVAILAAASGGLLCALAALAVDVGSVALHARQVQGTADLAALSAASDLSAAQRAALATAQANLGPGVRVQAETGFYAPNPALAAHQRFSSPAPGAAPNAARVVVTSPARLYFGQIILGRDHLDVTRQATAALEPQGAPLAAFSIGSRLARLDGGVANAVIGALAGGSVSLSVMDYEALLDADVSVLTWLDALAVELGVEAADYDALLATEVEAGRALGVLETLLDGRAGGALSEIAAAADGTLTLGELVGIEGGLGRNIQATASALDLTTALLEISNGARQVELDLAADAGLARLDAWLAVGERPNGSPWMTVTRTGAPIIRTAQTRLHLEAATRGGLAGLASIRLPVTVELAAAEARLDSLTCAPQRQVAIHARPGLARAWIGAVDRSRLGDFTQPLSPEPVALVSVLGLRIEGFSDIEAASPDWTRLTFSGHDIDTRAVRQVSTSGMMDSVTASLLQRLQLRVIGLDLGGVARSLGTLLAPLGPILDAVIEPVLETLGLKLGEADVRVHGLSCPQGGGVRAALVG